DPAVRAVPAARQPGRPQRGRHRARARDQQEVRGAARRPHLGGEPGEPGVNVSLHAPLDLRRSRRMSARPLDQKTKILYIEDNRENQRLVYRLLNQVEELKRLNQHFVRRASQLEDLHHSMQDITSELGVAPMLEKLLGGLAGAIGTTSLSVELTGPPAVIVAAPQNT